MGDPRPGRIRALDGLRGIAAVTVVVQHILSSFPPLAAMIDRAPDADIVLLDLDRTPLRLLWTGSEAVILFFVLSGFVLTLQIERFQAGSSYVTYIVRRVSRLYVPYLAIMLV